MTSSVLPEPDQRSTPSQRRGRRENLFCDHDVGSSPTFHARLWDRRRWGSQLFVRYCTSAMRSPRRALIWGRLDMLEVEGKSMSEYNAREVLDRYVTALGASAGA